MINVHQDSTKRLLLYSWLETLSSISVDGKENRVPFAAILGYS